MNSKINTNWSLIEEEGKSRRIEKKVGNSLFKNKKSNKFTHLLKRSILRMVHMETISSRVKSNNTYFIDISLSLNFNL
jgi:chaperonin cofactor prefoldin